jgi:hypothetical protein
MTLFKTLLAVGKISHTDFCLACFYADKAGCIGGDFQTYALGPGLQSGKYSAMLSKFNKIPNLYETVRVPTRPTSKHQAHDTDVNMLLVHESLCEEVRLNPDIMQLNEDMAYPECFLQHPITLECAAQGQPRPLALALYTDGVRYTSPLNSNVDSTVGYWVVNVCTGRRHLVAELKGNMSCACGCRGWCSSWMVLKYISWCLESLATGVRPSTRFTGEVVPDGHPVNIRRTILGPNLGFRAAVAWLKGDWSDVNKTHGIPAVTSVNNACPFCRCTKYDMHHFYPHSSLLGMAFEPVAQGDYDRECREREIDVQINDESARGRLVENCQYMKGDKRYGLTAVRDVAEFSLKSGDYAVPSHHLFNVRAMYTTPTPFIIQFWRQRVDASGVRKGLAVHRSPLFIERLGLEPRTACAIDFMHTICLGTLQKFVSTILWRAILGDVYCVGGTKDSIMEGNIRLMRDDLMNWYFLESIDHKNRLSDLTVRMLGGEPNSSDPEQFSGSGMRLKAHETLVMLPFAVTIAEKFPSIHLQPHLLRAGNAMIEFLHRLKQLPMRVPPEHLQPLHDLMLIHICQCEEAEIGYVPKHHFAAHLVSRTRVLNTVCPRHSSPPKRLG